ncbi:fatty acid desaturase 6 isoform X2 [Pelobates fuscus]|uniref:fatty acid desaturase 6 isoform X2 n=1 Tax=Pelobates fuscus TaxID=191477 RepID=UPI002FE4AC56
MEGDVEEISLSTTTDKVTLEKNLEQEGRKIGHFMDRITEPLLRSRELKYRKTPTDNNSTSDDDMAEKLSDNNHPRSLSEEELEVKGKWMKELSQMVQKEWKNSTWWEKYGIDWSIIGLAMCSLPAGLLCLGSHSSILWVLGIIILGLANSVLTMKGSHMASHRALCASPTLGRFWATFFMEVCSFLPVPVGDQGHVKLHHGHTNIIGLGDSSIWKAPRLSCESLKDLPYLQALQSLSCISLGLFCHLQLFIQVSGLGIWSALGCMFLSRTLLSIPFIHVNIFQHIGLPMFSSSQRPLRLQLMTHCVLNLPRNFLLDWTFGHAIISCHIEHHLFPHLSDHMCLKVKPLVSKFVQSRNLPYQEDTYVSRLQLFLTRYKEFMVLAPPITQLAELR